jgi:hypothetical protein
MTLTVRLYNIPSNMTHEQLTAELESLGIPILKVHLSANTNNTDENVGVAFIDVEEYQHLLMFGDHFSKLRHDLFIYKKSN